MMRNDSRFVFLACVPLVLAGCGVEPSVSSSAAEGDVWEQPVKVEFLQPFQGTWQFESREIESEEDTSGARITGGPDLHIDGHVIRFGNFPSESRLFSLHRHEGRICGKSWHHEDVHDPGDMSKEHVTLEITAGKLVIRRRYSSRSADPADPDVDEFIQVVADGDECPIVNDTDYGWSEWEACTYVRKNAP